MKMPRFGRYPIKPSQAGLSSADWTKSSLSMGSGNCVEVAHVPGSYVVRDSKNRSGPVLRFTPDEWRAFVGGVRNGDFDSI